MTERTWKSHSSDNFFGNKSDQESVKDGLGGPLGNREDAVKHYQKIK